MKVPQGRNPCLTFIAPEKKPASKFTKEGEVLKSTQKVGIEAIRSRFARNKRGGAATLVWVPDRIAGNLGELAILRKIAKF